MSAQQQPQPQQPQPGGGATDLLAAVRKLDAALASLLVLQRRQSSSTRPPSPSSPPPPPHLTHYRQIPPSLQAAYQCLDDGANLIHATSTKHALLFNIEAASDSTTSSATLDTASDLLRGCQLVATGATVVAQQCCASASHRTVRAARSIVGSTASLMELTTVPGGTAVETATNTNTTVAQRTGAVWDACDTVTNPTSMSSIPRGNRTAMRRDLLSYAQECHDTILEFQTMVDDSYACNDTDECDDIYNDDDTYDPVEVPVAVAGIALVRCSKGMLRLALQTLDAIGTQLDEPPPPTSGHADDNDNDNWEWSSVDQVRLTHLAGLYGAACDMGRGATDLGATLYPPLDLEEVTRQVQRQSDALQDALNAVANSAATNPNDVEDNTVDEGGREGDVDDTLLSRSLGSAVAELHVKLSAALLERRRQAAEALEALASSSPPRSTITTPTP